MMSRLVTNSAKPPVTPAPATGDPFIDRYNQRFRNPVTSLTHHEKREAGALCQNLVKRAVESYGDRIGGGMKNVYINPRNANDLDALRTHEQMFSLSSPHDLNWVIRMLRQCGEAATVDAVTKAHLNILFPIQGAMNSVRNGGSLGDSPLDVFDKRYPEVLLLAFLNPEQAPVFPSIITERRATTAEGIIAVFDGMDETPISMVEGVL